MSRRNHKSTERTYFKVQLVCPVDASHHLPIVVRQRGRDMLERGIERIDGPNGATKLRVVCPACRNAGVNRDHQLRWDRVLAVLDEMERSGEHERALHLPA